MERFSDLDEREILAVAIATEEEDARVYTYLAEDIHGRYPAEVENGHRRDLLVSSMGFAEALSDDGLLSGRGSPLSRGAIGGTMRRSVASAIRCRSWSPTAGPTPLDRHRHRRLRRFHRTLGDRLVRSRFVDTPMLKAIFQIVLCGAIVLATGILIGASGWPMSN